MLHFVLQFALHFYKRSYELRNVRKIWLRFIRIIHCKRGKAFVQWCEAEHISIKIHPAREANAKCLYRATNRTYREDVLDAYLFETLEEVWVLSDEWQNQL